jgi:hypothetical protein
MTSIYTFLGITVGVVYWIRQEKRKAWPNIIVNPEWEDIKAIAPLEEPVKPYQPPLC